MSRRRTPPTRDRGALLFTPSARPHEKRAAGLNHGAALCILVIVWGVEFQEVSPRPGRTTVALGLRAYLGSYTSRISRTTGRMRARHSPPRAQHQATASGMARSSSAFR